MTVLEQPIVDDDFLEDEEFFDGIQITYEDGTVVSLPGAPAGLLHGAKWVDWLVSAFDPIAERHHWITPFYSQMDMQNNRTWYRIAVEAKDGSNEPWYAYYMLGHDGKLVRTGQSTWTNVDPDGVKAARVWKKHFA